MMRKMIKTTCRRGGGGEEVEGEKNQTSSSIIVTKYPTFSRPIKRQENESA
jgi:hypothetical protein